MQRDNRIDIARGIGIFLVVLAHTQVRASGFINLFHVGIFFILAGMLFKEANTDSLKGLKDYIIKRTLRLYVPFVLWNIGFLCFRNLFNYVGIYNGSYIGLSDALKDVVRIIFMLHGELLDGPCWFIRALFVLQVIFGILDYGMKKIFKKNIDIARGVSAFCLLILGGYLSKKNIILRWDMSVVCSTMILFVIGLWLKKYLLKLESKKYYLPTNICLFVIGAVGTLILNNYGCVGYNTNTYPNIIFFVGAAMLGFGMVWGLSAFMDCKIKGMAYLFSYMGRKTMPILFLHLLGFKLVTGAWIAVVNHDISRLADFPVATTDVWYLYLIIGIIFPLIVDYLYTLISRKIKTVIKNKKYKGIVIAVAVMLVALLQLPCIAKDDNVNTHDNIYGKVDLSYVYNYDYYQTFNQDIVDTVGNDSIKMLEHFIKYGIAEGRSASDNFDVNVYRQCNSDLSELYGDDISNYYLHYVLYGIYENRKASENTSENVNPPINFSYVYDKDYYLMKNTDILEKYADASDVDIFRHFLEYGMNEGRVASPLFDYNVYRENNKDLNQAYQDDRMLYYLHYILYGHSEGRIAVEGDAISHEPGKALVIPSNVYEHSSGDIDIECWLTDKEHVALKYICNNKDLIGKAAVIYSMHAYEYTSENIVDTIKLEKSGEYEIALADINDKFILYVDDADISSNYAYINNPEMLGDNIENYIPKAVSKKGLQISSDIDEVEDLSPSFTFMNIIIEHVINVTKDDNSIVFTYKGKEFYINKSTIEYFDNLISRLTNDGINVCASVISFYYPEYKSLYYPGVDENTNATFYALNTSEQEGAEMVEAFAAYMSSRYNGVEGHGVISKWMVGNEVNDSGVYNYMGNLSRLNYAEEYGRTLRIIYNTIKSNSPWSSVYVAIEPWWNIDDNGMVYGGRNFVDELNAVIKEQGNIDWGMAYHAYSYPLCDPKVLNDDESALSDDGRTYTPEEYFTKDSLDTITITMENLDVLTDYFKTEDYLNASGDVRSIILSEQGYTSNSNLYGKCEALQAGSIAYAYYKAEMNDNIDAFIYFLQKDDNNASLGNDYYQFGLSNVQNGEKHKKLSYYVYRAMDTENSYELLSRIKDILCISDWNEVIENFNPEIFKSMKKKKYDVLYDGIDISSAEVADISNQQYTGYECLPEVEVKLGGVVLKNDIDYDVVYVDNIDKGTAKAIIVGIGEYIGIIEKTFTIVR